MQEPPNTKTASASYVCIFAEDINAQVRIGINESEKAAPQAVSVSIRLYAEPAAYFAGDIINYDSLHRAVKAWEDRPHTGLIETYLKELLPVCFADDRVTATHIRIAKPDIYKDAREVGVEVFMRRSDLEMAKSPTN